MLHSRTEKAASSEVGALPAAVLKWTPETPKEERLWIEDVRIGARGMMIVAALKEKGLERGRIGVVGIGLLRTALTL